MRKNTNENPNALVRVGLSHLTLILLVTSVGLNMLQANKLRAYQAGAQPALEAGAVAPVLEVATLDGQARTIDFSGRTTVLYYFSPECGWCEKNWLNVKALIAGTHDRVRFIGLSTTPRISEYMAERRLGFEVYTGLSLETVRAYGFGGTPQTVVISPEGIVEHVWPGAYGDRLQKEIEETFGFALPGLPKAVPTE